MLLVIPPICYRHWTHPTLIVVEFGQKRMRLFLALSPWFLTQFFQFWCCLVCLWLSTLSPGISIFLRALIIWSLVFVLLSICFTLRVKLFRTSTFPHYPSCVLALPLSSIGDTSPWAVFPSQTVTAPLSQFMNTYLASVLSCQTML